MRDFKKLFVNIDLNQSMRINIPAAKERLAEFQLELAEILRQGECTEVFDLTLALFPLTKADG